MTLGLYRRVFPASLTHSEDPVDTGLPTLETQSGRPCPRETMSLLPERVLPERVL